MMYHQSETQFPNADLTIKVSSLRSTKGRELQMA